jgi:uncharacterized Zn finger protein
MITCPNCGSADIDERGIGHTCQNCGFGWEKECVEPDPIDLDAQISAFKAADLSDKQAEDQARAQAEWDANDADRIAEDRMCPDSDGDDCEQ